MTFGQFDRHSRGRNVSYFVAAWQIPMHAAVLKRYRH